MDPHEFMWLKGKVYSLECKLIRMLKVLEDHPKDDGPCGRLTEKLIKILKSQPID